MHIKTYFNASCAVSAIEDLGSCKNAADAMNQFCTLELGKPDASGWNTFFTELASFYTFVAGPEVPKNHPNGSHWSRDHWVRYGSEFAQFIVDNKLGTVITLGQKYNFKHHPKTTAQVWLWNPDVKAVQEWWAKTLNIALPASHHDYNKQLPEIYK